MGRLLVVETRPYGQRPLNFDFIGHLVWSVHPETKSSEIRGALGLIRQFEHQKRAFETNGSLKMSAVGFLGAARGEEDCCPGEELSSKW